MSVQRWAEGFRGEWVTYADHVAALAEADECLSDVFVNALRECGAAWSKAAEQAYATGAAMALGKAREAVIAECIAHHGYTPGQTCPYCTDALAAIDALAAGQAPAPTNDGDN